MASIAAIRRRSRFHANRLPCRSNPSHSIASRSHGHAKSRRYRPSAYWRIGGGSATVRNRRAVLTSSRDSSASSFRDRDDAFHTVRTRPTSSAQLGRAPLHERAGCQSHSPAGFECSFERLVVKIGCAVDQRARRGRTADAVDELPVDVGKRHRPVQRERIAAIRPLVFDGDMEVQTRHTLEVQQASRRGVRHGSTGPQHCSQCVLMFGPRRPHDPIHTRMHSRPSTGLHSAADTGVGNAPFPRLRTREQPELRLRNHFDRVH